MQSAVGAQQRREGYALRLGSDARQGNSAVEVRDGAIDDTDTAELVAGRKVGGCERRESQTEPARKGEVDELCVFLLDGRRLTQARERRGRASRSGIQLLVRVVLVPACCAIEGIGDVVHELAHRVCNLRAGRVGALYHLCEDIGTMQNRGFRLLRDASKIKSRLMAMPKRAGKTPAGHWSLFQLRHPLDTPSQSEDN